MSSDSVHRVRMPFGKHRGKLLGDIPSTYLAWILRECTSIDPELREAVAAEVHDRYGAPPHTFSGADNGEPSRAVVDVRSIVRKWHREMVLKYHPDRNVGDDGKQMSAINHAYDRLQELLAIGS